MIDVLIYDDVGMPIAPSRMAQGLGGSEVQCILLAEALAASGLSVCVASRLPDDECQCGFGDDRVLEYKTVDDIRREGMNVRTLILSRFSSVPDVYFDRVLVMAQDADPKPYAHLAPLFAAGKATLVCVSNWQANRFPPAWRKAVIRPFMSEHARHVASGTKFKLPGRYVFPCAAVKGLDSTLRMWRQLNPNATLVVLGSGYDKPSATAEDLMAQVGAEYIPNASPSVVVNELARATGIFVVNEFPETFSMAVALADQLGCTTHVLAKRHGPCGMRAATHSPYVTTSPKLFRERFVREVLEGQRAREHELVDFDTKRITGEWLDVIRKPAVCDVQDRPATICLTILVKNGAATIGDAIESALPVVDRVFVLDTGSKDNTPDVVRATCAGRVPFEVVENNEPWAGFGDARSRLLALVSEAADYALMLDADDVIKIGEGFNKQTLTHDSYNITVEDGHLLHIRPHLIRLGKGYRYVRRLHEHLECDHDESVGYLPTLRYVRKDSGTARGVGVAKYLADARELEKDLAEEPDEPRTLFYLAQSYRDAAVAYEKDGDRDNARRTFRDSRDLYQRRAREHTPGDFEVFYSHLQCGIIGMVLDDPHESVRDHFLAAFDTMPERAPEPFYFLAKFYRVKGMPTHAYAFARAALGTPMPTGILVDPSCYGAPLADELACAAASIGRLNEAADMFRQLLAHPSVSAEQKPNIEANLKRIEAAQCSSPSSAS